MDNLKKNKQFMSKIRILFIAPTLPINNGSGGAIRSYQLYEELSAFADVDILTANSVGVSFPLLKKFRLNHRYLGHIVTSWEEHFFESKKKISSRVKEIIERNQYDYVFIRYYNTAYRLGALGLDNLVLDCDDCYIELLKQTPPQHKFRIFNSQLNSISAYFRKRNYLKSIQITSTVIFSKKSELVKWGSNFLLITNKISAPQESLALEKSQPTFDDKTTILFVGVLNYAPNYEGLDHFIEKIWPNVIKENSSVTLKVVGNGLPDHLEKKWLSVPQINICGYVDNINSVYEGVDFSIAPVFKGSGTHIKVMESLARKKTMVISHLAHRGYEEELIDGESVFVAGNDFDFAKKVIYLCRNAKQRENMGKIGQQKILDRYTFYSCKFYDSTLKKHLKTKNKNILEIKTKNRDLAHGEIYE